MPVFPGVVPDKLASGGAEFRCLTMFSPTLAMAQETVIATVPVGWAPYSAAVNHTTNRVYTANYQGCTVSVIDVNTNTRISEIAIGGHTTDIAVDETTNRVYASHFYNCDNAVSDGTKVTVIDGNTNQIIQRLTTGGASLGGRD